MPAEQGALIVRAPEMAMDENVGARPAGDNPHLEDGPHVTAETSRRIDWDLAVGSLFG